MSRVRFKDAKYVVSDTRQRLTDREGSGGGWTEGVVRTPHGWVWVYSQPADKWDARGYTILSVIVDGYEYERRIDRHYGQRGIAIMAGRFAREVWP